MAGPDNVESTPSPAVAPAPAAGAEPGAAVGTSPPAPAAPVAPAPPAPPAPPEPPAAPIPEPPKAPEPITAPEPAKPAQEFKPSFLEEGKTDPAKAPEPPKVDAPVGEAKPAEEKKPAESGGPKVDAPPAEAAPPPIVYDFKWPDTIDPQTIDKAVLGQYTEILNKARVAPEIAQELADRYATDIGQVGTRLAEHQWEVFNRQQEADLARIKADPELGGSRAAQTQKNAAAFIETFGGTPEQQKAVWDKLRTSGAGNDPEIVRLFSRAGIHLAKEPEAKPTPPARQAPLTREQKQRTRYGA